MKISKRTYKLTGMTRILGAQAANPKVHSEFIAAKAASILKAEEETGMLPEGFENRGLTVFLRDNKVLCLSDYVIKGFFKEALGALKSQIGIVAHASKVDNFVLITPAYLRFMKNGEDVTEPDEIFERPLRAMTMQGPRVSVSASETIDAGWELTFTVSLLDNPASPKSKALTFDVIEEALDYGAFKGLGQWRNGQNGRFTWETVNENA